MADPQEPSPRHQTPPYPSQGPGYGAAPGHYPYPYAYPYPPQKQTNGKAVASFILGICGLLLIPLIGSLLAVIFGYGARNEIHADPNQAGDGFAVAGLVMGWIGLAIIALIFLIILIVLLISFAVFTAVA